MWRPTLAPLWVAAKKETTKLYGSLLSFFLWRPTLAPLGVAAKKDTTNLYGSLLSFFPFHRSAAACKGRGAA